MYRFPSPSMARPDPLFDTLIAAVVTDSGVAVTPFPPPPIAINSEPGDTPTSGPCPMAATPAIPTTSLLLFSDNGADRIPGYCGLNVTGTWHTVPAAFTVPPKVQPVTVPTTNSCTPFCAVGVVILLIAVAACNVMETVVAAELEPTAVVGSVAKTPLATAAV